MKTMQEHAMQDRSMKDRSMQEHSLQAHSMQELATTDQPIARRSQQGPITWATGKHPPREAGPDGEAERLGSALVARSARGVCAILLGEDKALLAAELAGYFPKATLQEDEEALAGLLADWWAYLDEPSRGFSHPLDIDGTPLQQQVWAALRAIPPGSTLTYTDLAARVGRPQAVRAVASACAANRLAVVIPCHRVIGRSGSLTGYRWGIDRKRSLLALEARE